jgi:hypothetical protein
LRRGGDPYAMPPEVLHVNLTADAHRASIDYSGTDAWALGRVLYELARPAAEAWVGLRAAASPFEYRFRQEQLMFLRPRLVVDAKSSNAATVGAAVVRALRAHGPVCVIG